MSTIVGNSYNPVNGAVEERWEGFSWPCLFLGFIWYIYKGMWGWSVIALILALVTGGLAWLIFPFFANEQHAEWLLKQGYLDQKQWRDRRDRDSSPVKEHPKRSIGVTRKCPYCAEEIKLKAIVCKHCGKDVEPIDIGDIDASRKDISHNFNLSQIDAAINDDEDTQLIEAVRTGDIIGVKMLVSLGANTEIKNMWGSTALMIAEREGQQEIMKLLSDQECSNVR